MYIKSESAKRVANLKEEKGKLQVTSMDEKSRRPFEDESS